MHPDDDVIQRLAHGELDDASARAVRGHVRGCASCRERGARLHAEEEEIDALLGHVDSPVPQVRVEHVVARALEAPVDPGPLRRAASRRRPPSRWGRWAAGIALTLGAAGALFAAPGSPLPAWLASVRERIAGETPRPGLPTPASDAEPEEPAAGIAVDPGPALDVVFAAAQESGDLTVAVVDGGQVAIRATGGAPGFRSELGRVVIGNQGSTSDFEVEIPRGAPRVEVRIGERVVFRLEAGRVTTRGELREDGRYAVPWSEGGG